MSKNSCLGNIQIRLYIFILLIVSSGLKANDRFRFIDISKELSTREIKKVYQDRENYIWFASYNGLIRYDGYNQIVYKIDKEKERQSINSFVVTMVQDSHNNLWIGTQNGINVLNKESGSISKIDNATLNNVTVEDIIPTGDYTVWISTNKGLFRYDYETNEVEQCNTYDCKSMIVDKKGYLWFGTWQQGLWRYNIDTGESIRYKNLNPENSAHVLYQDSVGDIWVGSWGYGLYRLTDPYDDDKAGYINYTANQTNNSLVDNIIYTIAEDNNGNMWVGSRGGLSILDPKNHTFKNYLPDQSSRSSIPFNEVNSIVCTKDGVIWLGMLGGGVCKAIPDKGLFNIISIDSVWEKFKTRSVRTIFYDERRTLWMGIMGFGFVSYDRQTGQFKGYKEYPEFKKLKMELSTINACIERRESKELCFATWDAGVWFYNRDTKKVRVLNTDTEETFDDVCVYSLLEDHNNNLWIGTRRGIGILDSQGEYYPINTQIEKGLETLPISTVFKLVESNNNMVWGATNRDGIVCIDNSKQTKSIKFYSIKNNKLNVESVLTLYIDSSNRLWAGSDGYGLLLFDEEQDNFIPFSQKHHLLGDIVNNILEDDNKRLWITTNKGMTELHINSNNEPDYIYNYTEMDGLQDNFFNQNSSFKAEDGEMMFGGYRGINNFHSQAHTEKELAHSLVITDFKIFNKSLKDLPAKEKDKVSDKTIDYTSEVTLSHNQNNFNIEFSLLDFTDHSQNAYAYKLEGYDEDWVYTGTERHFAYYNNLRSGEYTFHLKGCSSSGVWNLDEKVLKISILPPPWLTKKALALYALLILALGYGIIRFLKKRLEGRRALELVETRRLKEEEINHNKLLFFTNITHELMTPLTIISASLELLNDMKSGNKKAFLSIQTNVLRLMRLIQQILEFRKVESGNSKLKISEGNITSFIENSINAFLPLIRKKKLTVNFDHEEVIFSFFDADKLDKIMYNLLSNAAKFNKEGGHIDVLLKYDAEADTVCITVIDSGVGMDKKTIDTLFQRFYDSNYNENNKFGTGIGLSLTKDLVDLHKGTIIVESEPGIRSIFIITLPASISAYENEPFELFTDVEVEGNSLWSEFDELEKEEIQIYSTVTDLPKKKYNILLVDDNLELLDAIFSLLSVQYDVVTAIDGLQALAIVEKRDFDLIISDVMMPNMDGFELSRRIKTTLEYSHIPIILLTAKQTEEDQISGYESGADGYVFKPVSMALLYAQINNLLQKKERMIIDFKKQLVFDVKEINYNNIDKDFVQKAIDIVNENISDVELDLSSFSSKMNTSRTTLNDKLKSLTGFTPTAFINHIRLNVSRQIIEKQSNVYIADLAFQVGYSDSKYFSTLFKRKFGASPSEYIASFNKKQGE